MSLGDVVDEFLDEHSLSDTSTTKKTNLSTTSVRSEEVNDLDTGFKDLSGCGLVDEWRGVCVNGGHLDTLDRTTLVNGLANNVHDTAECRAADGNLDGGTGVDDLLSTDETLGTVHGNGTNGVLAKVRGNLEDETATGEVLHLQGIENWGEVLSLKLNVDDGTNDSLDRADSVFGLSSVCARCYAKLTWRGK